MPRRDLLIIIAAVLLLRLPFLNQAVQGDESTFLTSAAHAQIDPLHPNHTHYIFTSVERDVDLRGGSHLPMNAWVLAALIAVFGEVKEVPFHAAYIAFSLLAAIRNVFPRPPILSQALMGRTVVSRCPGLRGKRGLLRSGRTAPRIFPLRDCGLHRRRRFSKGQLGKEHDQPRLARPIRHIPLLRRADRHTVPHRHTDPARVSLAAGALLGAGWIVAFAPCVARAAWEIFERITSGVFPFTMTMRYVHEQHWDGITPKLLNIAGLLIHLWFIVFPVLFAAEIWAAWHRRNRDTAFLALWIAIYLAGAFVLFFSGSARYLLPIAAPIAILASFARPSWLAAGFAIQMALSVCLATENYQHWAAYRNFTHQLLQQTGGRRLWINSEWGLRHYLEDAGARIPSPGQFIPAGDIVVWSELAHPVRLSYPGEIVASFIRQDVRPSMPFRLIGLESHSGYSSIDKGLLPFGIGRDLVDRIHGDIYKEAKPTLMDLPMNAPEASAQILSGIYDLEQDKQRWTSGVAMVMLVSPPDPQPLHASILVPDNAPARKISLMLDGRMIHAQILPGPGMYRIVSSPQKAAGATSVASLQVDRVFQAPGDSRQLGVVLFDLGWGK